MKYHPAASAEFPNDNTELHDGALWVRPRLIGRAKPLIRLATLALPSTLPGPIDDDVDADSFELEPTEQEQELEIDIEVDDDLDVEPPAPVAEAEPVAPTQPDVFAAFVAATVRIALGAGGTRAAAALPLLFNDAALDALAGDATLCDRLIAAGLVERAGNSLRASAAFASVAAAWRAVLRGESEDLAACGSSTLDEWTAGLLATLLEAPDSRRRELKRELRKNGVAAFGMISAAA